MTANPTSSHVDDSRTVTVPVWAQDPLSMPTPVEIEIPNIHLESGPRDAQFVVVDEDLSAGVVYQPALFLPDENRFAEFALDDVRFHQINAYAISRRTLDIVEDAIGRQVHWSFGPQLTIYPHFFEERNAFYSREAGALAFMYFDLAFREGKIFTCLSHDVVAHELGHAALDGLKPGYYMQIEPETGAFHESFGDLTAMFSALAFPEVVAQVMQATGGDLSKPNLASRMGEEFGYGIYGPGHYFLRYAGSPITFSTIRTFEVHDYSELLTATMYEILVAFYNVNRQRNDEDFTAEEALLEAVRHLRRIAFRAVNYLPPNRVTFRRYGQALIAADERAFPSDDLGYRHIIKEVFTKREIVKKPEDLDLEVDLALTWDGSSDARSLYHFVYQHRTELGIPPHVVLNYPSIATVDFTGMTSKGAAQLQETVVEYSYPAGFVEIVDEVTGTIFGAIPVHHGATLVFDQDRRLVARFRGFEPSDLEPDPEAACLAHWQESYEELKLRGQVRTLRPGAPRSGVDDAVYTLYPLPEGRAGLRLNVCSRFRSRSGEQAGRRVVQVGLPR